MARATVDVTALGRAIVHAADLGARVIVVSGITCLPADRNIDQGALGAAIRYAAVDKDAVDCCGRRQQRLDWIGVQRYGVRFQPAHRLEPSRRPPQLGGRDVGVGAVLVAAVRAVGGLIDTG